MPQFFQCPNDVTINLDHVARYETVHAKDEGKWRQLTVFYNAAGDRMGETHLSLAEIGTLLPAAPGACMWEIRRGSPEPDADGFYHKLYADHNDVIAWRLSPDTGEYPVPVCLEMTSTGSRVLLADTSGALIEQSDRRFNSLAEALCMIADEWQCNEIYINDRLMPRAALEHQMSEGATTVATEDTP
jgi:hypothetical protein